jgi:hypothetical protein
MMAAIFFSAACYQMSQTGSSAQPRPTSVTPLPANLTPPQRIGRYLMVDQLPYSDAGTLFRFRDDAEARLSVFVYPVGEEVQQGADTQIWTSTEGYKFGTTMMEMVQSGAVRTFQMQMGRPDTLTVTDRRIPGYVSVASTEGRGGRRVELEFVYLVRSHFIRIHATTENLEWSQSDIPVFARTLATRLATVPP